MSLVLPSLNSLLVSISIVHVRNPLTTHDKEIISLARQSATDPRHTRSGKLDIVRSCVAKHTPSSPSGMSRENSADVAASLPIRIANYEVLRLACRFRFFSCFFSPSFRPDREVLFPDAESRPLFNLRAARYPAIMKPLSCGRRVFDQRRIAYFLSLSLLLLTFEGNRRDVVFETPCTLGMTASSRYGRPFLLALASPPRVSPCERAARQISDRYARVHTYVRLPATGAFGA